MTLTLLKALRSMREILIAQTGHTDNTDIQFVASPSAYYRYIAPTSKFHNLDAVFAFDGIKMAIDETIEGDIVKLVYGGWSTQIELEMFADNIMKELK